MTTITAALLLLGTCLAGFGTFAFLASATTGADPETLRITLLAALFGRDFAGSGLLLWLFAHPATPAPYTLLLMAASAALLAAQFTIRAAPGIIRRAASWSF